jgi:hypothetical protein
MFCSIVNTKKVEVSSMSKIWEILREAQRLREQRVDDEGLQNYWDAIRNVRDRRSTKRFFG